MYKFRPTLFRPSFRYGCKWTLVSASHRRSTALLSWLSLKRLTFRIMTAVSSRRPSASGHTLNMLQLISPVNRQSRSRIVVVVYLLQFVGMGYLDRSITSSYIRFRLGQKSSESFGAKFGYGLILISQLRPFFDYDRN